MEYDNERGLFDSDRAFADPSHIDFHEQYIETIGALNYLDSLSHGTVLHYGRLMEEEQNKIIEMEGPESVELKEAFDRLAGKGDRPYSPFPTIEKARTAVMETSLLLSRRLNISARRDHFVYPEEVLEEVFWDKQQWRCFTESSCGSVVRDLATFISNYHVKPERKRD